MSNSRDASVQNFFGGNVQRDASFDCIVGKQIHAIRMTTSTIGKIANDSASAAEAAANAAEAASLAREAAEGTATETNVILASIKEINRKLDTMAEQQKQEEQEAIASALSLVYQTICGSGNNLQHPSWGSTNEVVLRVGPRSSQRLLLGHNDDPTIPPAATTALPNPRMISNAICQGQSMPSSAKLSDITWAWGQFLDHELIIIPHQSASTGYPENPEHLDIQTPSIEEDPAELFPDRTIPFVRSAFVLLEDGDDERGRMGRRRDNLNEQSSFINASSVYGSTTTRAYALRRLDGSGKLKTSLANNGEVLPPRNEPQRNLFPPMSSRGLPNATPPGEETPSRFFLCGDIRSNEHPLLTSIHTLLVREHNRLCDEIIRGNNQQQQLLSSSSDEMIYQQARRLVTGIIQAITYNEFLPALIGTPPLSPPQQTQEGDSSRGSSSSSSFYDPSINATISNEFATVGFRIGHTMVSGSLAVAQGNASSSSGDNQKAAAVRLVPLRDVFFDPTFIQNNGCDRVLLGARNHLAQEIDGILVEDLRSFLFGSPSSSMMHDLASLNIQRGRDHDIGSYNDLRKAYGLSRISSFAELPTGQITKDKLERLYAASGGGGVDDIDAWIMGIVETHLPATNVGPLFYRILSEEFTRICRGDRFFYLHNDALTDTEKQFIHNTTLADLLERNTQYSLNEIGENAFYCQ